MTESIDRLADILLGPEQRAGGYEEAFGRLGFKYGPKASSLWKRLAGPLELESHAAENAASLLAELADCPDPDMALLNLSRFADACTSPSQFFGSIFLEKPLCHLLIVIFSCSYYLTDILVRNPGYLSWLIERDTLGVPKHYDLYLKELKDQMAPFTDGRRRLNSIKRYRRREFLRIGTRDLLGLSPVDEVTAELSYLADAIIETIAQMVFAMEAARAGLGEVHWDMEGSLPFHRFAVQSLGKLGGSELNYSSDIDLLYVCEVTGGKHESAFYTAMARGITAELTSVTEEGALYRVDLRLRPDGEHGPLVVTLEEHMNYMLRRAHPWERQALLKARHSAGNPGVSERFKANCDKVVFSPISDSDPLAGILTMRERAIANLPGRERDGNIKLMPGGIRDIEFIAQALQLMHGPSRPQIRSGNTLDALERLRDNGLLSGQVMESVSRCYRIFRTVEHRLQMLCDVRTHTLPKDDEELLSLGARVAHSALKNISGEGFRAELGRSIQLMQKLFGSFFRDRKPGEIPLLLSFPPGEKEVEKMLSRYGILEGERSHRFLSSLVYGDFPDLEGPETLNAAARHLPHILEKVSATPYPSLTLKNLVQIIKATGAVRSTLELLTGGGDLLRLLLGLSSLSTRLTQTISKRPELLDALAEGIPPGDPPDAGGNEQARLNALKLWYEESLLYIHCQNPVPKNGPEVLGPLFSEISEKAVKSLFDISGGGETPAAVFALGSLGNRECRFGSDLDLVAVIPDGSDPAAASGVIRRLSEYGRRTHISPIDVRLRGEGDGSPLVQTLESYRNYFYGRAAFWELVAFTKRRFICGSRETGAAFDEIINKFLSPKKTGTELKAELVSARKKLESLSSGPWDIKHAPGGLYDIGFIDASASFIIPPEELRETGVMQTVERLRSEGLLGKRDAAALAGAYRLYYLIEHAAALHDIAFPPLPERESFLESYMTRLLGGTIPGKGPFTAKLEKTKQAIRKIFLHYIDRLG